MPFIKPDRRELIKKKGLSGLDSVQPGDICYVHYKKMVEKWKEKPSWTTAHEIYKDMINSTFRYKRTDDTASKELAWQMFLVFYVLNYELKKRKENGGI